MAEQSCNEHLLFTGCFAHLQAAGFTIPGVEKEFTKNPSGKKNHASIGKKTVIKRQMRHQTKLYSFKNVSRYLCSDSLPFFHRYTTQWWGVSIFDKLSVTCHQTAHNKKGWTMIFCRSKQAPPYRIGDGSKLLDLQKYVTTDSYRSPRFTQHVKEQINYEQNAYVSPMTLGKIIITQHTPKNFPVSQNNLGKTYR